MVCNRLEVICHEDTVAAPWIVPFAATAVAQSKERYTSRIGETRLMIGSAIRIMARAPKSRAGCHFAAAIGLRSLLEGSRRRYRTGPTISTPSPGKSWGATSITPARKVRS